MLPKQPGTKANSCDSQVSSSGLSAGSTAAGAASLYPVLNTCDSTVTGGAAICFGCKVDDAALREMSSSSVVGGFSFKRGVTVTDCNKVQCALTLVPQTPIIVEQLAHVRTGNPEQPEVVVCGASEPGTPIKEVDAMGLPEVNCSTNSPMQLPTFQQSSPATHQKTALAHLHTTPINEAPREQSPQSFANGAGALVTMTESSSRPLRAVPATLLEQRYSSSPKPVVLLKRSFGAARNGNFLRSHQAALTRFTNDCNAADLAALQRTYATADIHRCSLLSTGQRLESFLENNLSPTTLPWSNAQASGTSSALPGLYNSNCNWDASHLFKSVVARRSTAEPPALTETFLSRVTGSSLLCEPVDPHNVCVQQGLPNELPKVSHTTTSSRTACHDAESSRGNGNGKYQRSVVYTSPNGPSTATMPFLSTAKDGVVHLFEEKLEVVFLNDAVRTQFGVNSGEEFLKTLQGWMKADPGAWLVLQESLTSALDGEMQPVSHMVRQYENATGTLTYRSLKVCPTWVVCDEGGEEELGLMFEFGAIRRREQGPATCPAREREVLSKVPAQITLFTLDGKVLQQNDLSQAFLGSLVKALKSHQRSHCGGGLEDEADDQLMRLLTNNLSTANDLNIMHPSSWLQQMFSLAPVQLNALLTAVHQGQGWSGLIPVNDTQGRGKEPQGSQPPQSSCDDTAMVLGTYSNLETGGSTLLQTLLTNASRRPSYALRRLNSCQDRHLCHHGLLETNDEDEDESDPLGFLLSTNSKSRNGHGMSTMDSQDMPLHGDPLLGRLINGLMSSYSSVTHATPVTLTPSNRSLLATTLHPSLRQHASPFASGSNFSQSPQSFHKIPCFNNRSQTHHAQDSAIINSTTPSDFFESGSGSIERARWKPALIGGHKRAAMAGGKMKLLDTLGPLSEDPEVEKLWFEVHASVMVDPVTHEQVVMLVSSDVSLRVRAQQCLTAVTQKQQQWVQECFPRHIITELLKLSPALAKALVPLPNGHTTNPLFDSMLSSVCLNAIHLSENEVTNTDTHSRFWQSGPSTSSPPVQAHHSSLPTCKKKRGSTMWAEKPRLSAPILGGANSGMGDNGGDMSVQAMAGGSVSGVSDMSEEQMAMMCKTLSRKHEQVTVMFAQVVGFNDLLERVGPCNALAHLSAVFNAFDSLLDQYGVYKVETKSSCYVAATGLMRRNLEGGYEVQDEPGGVAGAESMMHFAKALYMLSRTMATLEHNKLQLTIGLHTGDLVSGVVGQNKPWFCLFGDTMNMASRMQSTCPKDSIQVSEDVHALLANKSENAKSHCGRPNQQQGSSKWDLRSTGGVLIKGKGVLETFVWQPKQQMNQWRLRRSQTSDM